MSFRAFSAGAPPAHDGSLWSMLGTAAAVTLTVGILLLLAPGVVPSPHLIAFIKEDGPLEVATVLVWMLAAVYLLWPGRRPRLPALSFAFFCFTLGMRENGLPASIVPHGRRLMQLGFYLHGPESLAYRVVTALVVLAVLAAALHVMWFVGREFIQRRGLVYADTCLFILGMAVLVGAQVAEGLQDHPALAIGLFPSGWSAMLSLESLEEGWEALGVLYVLVAVYVSRRLGREQRRFS